MKRFAKLAVAAAICSTLPARARQVITWVAPYKVAASSEMLDKDFGGVGMKDGLTYLALQFWVTDGPGLKQDANVAGPDFDNTVKWFHDWARAHGVKVTLCVTDYVGGWNWAEAQRSFKQNRAAFVSALVAEADRLDLDGVELDLEGELQVTMIDGNAFIAFAGDLAGALHAKGKTVTAASYPAQWNAPNWAWWPGLMKVVDGVTSMGYEQTGKASANGFNYADQKTHAPSPDKLMIGMPGWKASWEGYSAAEQLDWVVADGDVGVGIWDCGLDDGAWQTAAVWQRIKRIHDSAPNAVLAGRPASRPALGGRTLIDAKGARLPKGNAHRWAVPEPAP